jgi:hypothetical protein
VKRDKKDGTDYKKLSQKFARAYLAEVEDKKSYRRDLERLADPAQMGALVTQNEFEKTLERLQESTAMFIYLKDEMKNAENYKTQIHDLKNVVKEAHHKMQKLADLQMENEYLRQAHNLTELEGPAGIFKTWLANAKELRCDKRVLNSLNWEGCLRPTPK